jgi:hypothetical protein
MTNVNLEFLDVEAQSITVHAQFSRSAALISLILLQHGQNEFLLELTHRFRVKNVAPVHLKD